MSRLDRKIADSESTMRGNVRAFQQSLTTAYGALKFPDLGMSSALVVKIVRLVRACGSVSSNVSLK